MSLNKIDHQQFIRAMDLPTTVKIVEVSPRDGLQNHAQKLSVASKITLINRLSACGLSSIEVGSLVSPKRVPQMAESEAVYQGIEIDPAIQYLLLLANQQGFNRAIQIGTQDIAVFCSATDAFSLNNINCTVAESLVSIKSICEQASDLGIAVRAYLSCVLGCPFQGEVDVAQVSKIAAQLYQFGIHEISLGDTIGVGTVGQVKALLKAVADSVPVDNLAVHFHDTYGQALANILIALQSGISIIDCSVSGLGGCPFAPGAAGNVATEDVIYLLNGLGIETGVDLKQLISTSWFISHVLQRQPASGTALANRPDSQF